MKLNRFFQFIIKGLSGFLQSRIKIFKSVNFVKQNDEEWKLYTLNRFQLKNLVEKNIYFHFFQLEDFSLFCDKDTKLLLEKVKRREKEKLVLQLDDEDLKQPIVLICEKGFISKQVFQVLRAKGFINVYFVEGGLAELLKNNENI